MPQTGPEILTAGQVRVAEARLSAHPALSVLIARHGPCPIAPRPGVEPWQALCSAVIHQQLAGHAAAAIESRFLALLGADPAPAVVLAADDDALRGAGLSRQKAAAIRDIALRAAAGALPDRARADALTDDELVASLTAARGVGRWTVEMLLIFTLGRPDVWPVDDYGIRKGWCRITGVAELPPARVLRAWAQPWRPWRSVLAWYLWRAAEDGMRRLAD